MLKGLKDIPFFQDLSAAELNAVKVCLREKSYEKGEILFHEGRACERVFIVRTGRVKVYRLSASGREQILENLNPGDTCACNPGCFKWECTASASAVTPCTVWFLSRADYVRMVQTNSNLVHALNRLFADRLRHFSALIEDVSLKDVKKRLIKFLLDMLEETRAQSISKDVLFIPFTRQEIAQRIGAARETVARQFYQLKRAKLIDIKSHQIIILNRQALEELLLR